MNTLEYINYTLSKTPKRFHAGAGFIDWNKASKENPIQWIYQITKQNKKYNSKINTFITKLEYDEDNTKNIKIVYSENFSPNLVKFRGSKHDGTLLFSLEHIQDIFSGLLDGSTYCTENIPEENYGDNPEIFFKYDLVYTVGDLLWGKEYVGHVDENHGKMFPGVKDEFALAVKVDYIIK